MIFCVLRLIFCPFLSISHPFADRRFGGFGGAKKQPKKAPEKQQKTKRKNRTENSPKTKNKLLNNLKEKTAQKRKTHT
jgi:hypothetical protein